MFIIEIDGWKEVGALIEVPGVRINDGPEVTGAECGRVITFGGPKIADV